MLCICNNVYLLCLISTLLNLEIRGRNICIPGSCMFSKFLEPSMAKTFMHGQRSLCVYIYNDSRQIVKLPIVHLHHLLSSNSFQTAYCATGVSNCSNSFTKIIYTGAYMILNAQNLYTFSKCHKFQGCNLTSVSVRCHFLVCSHVWTREGSFVPHFVRCLSCIFILRWLLSRLTFSE